MLNKILEHYGPEHQIDKFAEELIEMGLAILQRNDKGMEPVLKEYADVKVLKAQFDRILTEEQHKFVRGEMTFKINRQIKRMEASDGKL